MICGKSFVLYPLGEISKVFKPPGPAGKPGDPLSKLISCEFVLVSEYEWDGRSISWAGLKQLLEGDAVLVALPKNPGEDKNFREDNTRAPEDLKI